MSDKTEKNFSVSRRGVMKGAAVTGAGLALGAKSNPAWAVNYLQGAQIELDYGTWFFEEPGRGGAWRKLIEKFHAEQTDIKINEAGGAFNDFTNNVITQLQAGRLEYDLVQTTPDLVLRLLDAGVLTPLGSVLEANNITTLSGAHDYITVDGQPMGLDVVTVVFGLLHNQALTTGAGMTLPTTTDEWLAFSTELTERPNKFGMWSPHLISEPESFWFTLQEWACPFDTTWATGFTPNLTSEGILNAVTLFKNFYDAAYPQGTDDGTATVLWAEGQLAQQLIVSAAVNIFKDTAPEVYPDIRSIPLPWASKKSIARIHPITVNNQSENADAGVEFITWLYKPENYRMLLMEQLDVIPAYEVGELDEYLGELLWLEGYKDINFTTPPQMVGDFIFNNQEFGTIVINRVAEVLNSGRPVEDAMADAQAEAEELAANLQG